MAKLAGWILWPLIILVTFPIGLLGIAALAIMKYLHR